jgi:hypothetical protein
MTKKPSNSFRTASSQRVVVLETITDPAELAALDETVREARKDFPFWTALDVLYDVPAEERVGLLRRLAAELPPDAQLELIKELVVQLPSKPTKKRKKRLAR